MAYKGNAHMLELLLEKKGDCNKVNLLKTIYFFSFLFCVCVFSTKNSFYFTFLIAISDDYFISKQ